MRTAPTYKPHARAFEQQRGQLYAIAYRMLGALSEAEDVLQDAWVKWQAVDLQRVDTPAAYLTSIVSRLCIDRQRRARVEKLIYTGPWLPEPASDAFTDQLEATPFGNPEGNARQAESISMAFLVVLQALGPMERAVFILKEAFDTDHSEIAETLDITVAHSRQLLRRARIKIAGAEVIDAPQQQTQALFEQFLTAAATGDMDALHELMTDDIVAYSDGGGRASAALIPLHGKTRVATVLLHLMKNQPVPLTPSFVKANGGLCLVLKAGDEIHSSHSIRIKGNKVAGIYSTRNPEKLRYLSS